MEIRTAWMGFSACAALFALANLGAEEKKDEPFPVWDGRETVADYAKRAGLAPAKALDLGRGVTLEMVLIPAGKFTMGSPESEQDRFSSEGPQHEVTISRPLYMGKYTLTVGQFAQFVKATNYQTEAEKEGSAYVCTGVKFAKQDGANWRKPGFEQTDQHPVTQVTWDDAQKFCEWMSQQSKQNVRLPTEAEWEYACRAGTRTRFNFGNDEGQLCKHANYSDSTCTADFTWRDKAHSDGFDRTSPVGSFKPNAWGLYDMHGNVFEWCQDWYAGEYPAGPAADPTGPASGSFHVLRGGSWCYGLAQCRSAYRTRNAPEYQFYISRSFRVVAGAR